MPQRKRQNLRAIAHQERGVRDIVVEVEGEEADNDDDTCGRGARGGVDGAAGRPNDVGDEHAEAAPVEEGASAEAVDEEGCAEGCGEVEDLR